MKHAYASIIAGMQKHIQPLNMNGLNGRMLRIKTKRKAAHRDILLIYGHHASLERMYGIAEALADYGDVTMPDLPGFGGMDSFYRIGMKPNLDNFADYLASFVKLKYRGKKVTIAGMSLGFAIATRMLQRYPELVRKVDLMISIVGFSHKYDYSFSRPRYLFYRYGASLFSHRVPAAFFYNVVLHPAVIRATYANTHNARNKFMHLTEAEKKAAIEFEVDLWHLNDLRTHMYTAVEMLTIDNCGRQVKLPVHHISVAGDQYFDHAVVEQHMRIIFTDFIDYEAKIPNHAPSILASKKEAAPFVPSGVKKLLRSKRS